MPRRPLAVVTALVATGTLLAGTTAVAGASVGAKAKPPLCAGKTKAKAVKAIKKAWDTAFNGNLNITLDEKFGVIEGSGDPAFRAVLDGVATANAATLKATNADVHKVTCAGKKAADVQWDLVLSGTPAPGLAPPGQAVLVGKAWKVAQTTVCDLFALADPTLTQSGPCADVANGVAPSSG
jgi:hypothetical protein